MLLNWLFILKSLYFFFNVLIIKYNVKRICRCEWNLFPMCVNVWEIPNHSRNTIFIHFKETFHQNVRFSNLTLTSGYVRKKRSPAWKSNLVSGVSTILKFAKSFAIPILISAIANRMPMQTLGPPPKGRNANCFASFSFASSPPFSQFHQHFKGSFFADCLSPKNYKHKL